MYTFRSFEQRAGKYENIRTDYESCGSVARYKLQRTAIFNQTSCTNELRADCNQHVSSDFRLQSQCKLDLRSSAILHSLEWQFRTDVSVQAIDPNFEGQEFQVPEDLSTSILRAAGVTDDKLNE